MIDPMIFDESAEAIEKKRNEWMKIFDLHPDFSDAILDVAKKTNNLVFVNFKVVIDEDNKRDEIVIYRAE